MIIENNKAREVKIAYVGGGSRGWAWGLMEDLALAGDIEGSVNLYDIDFEAAKVNELIGNRHNNTPGVRSRWQYKACETIGEALAGADFVVISIMPGTFDEMESDVHTPEKYGILQTVGDTTGPGGIIRAMRTVPMYEVIGRAVRDFCPNAWVITYTNPMAICVRTLYRVFPGIKAFGCCHEVFGTQEFLATVVEETLGIKELKRQDIDVNPIGVNHFTWLTEAKYKNIDLFPLYHRFCEEHPDGILTEISSGNWVQNVFINSQLVKMTLFERFGWIAAAGDRHLAEFCPGGWFLGRQETIDRYKFARTPVSFRREDLVKRLARAERLKNGEEELSVKRSGEEGLNQIRALLGLCELVTNVNLPNRGQIPNLPLGSVVETNAVFRGDSVTPVMAGELPESIAPLVQRACEETELVSKGIAERDINQIFAAFINDPLVTCSVDDAKELFNTMTENTKTYLGMYPEITVR